MREVVCLSVPAEGQLGGYGSDWVTITPSNEACAFFAPVKTMRSSCVPKESCPG